MTKAIIIISSLVGYEMAVKVWMLIKMFKIRVDGWGPKEYEELLKDPRFRKYLR